MGIPLIVRCFVSFFAFLVSRLVVFCFACCFVCFVLSGESWFLCFKVSEVQRFKSKKHCMFSGRIDRIFKNFKHVPCVLQDIDFEHKIVAKFFDESSGCVGVHFPTKIKTKNNEWTSKLNMRNPKITCLIILFLLNYLRHP